MISKVMSVAPHGYGGIVIEVEGDLKRGLPGVQIVGMGNKSIDEAKERVRSAISNSLLDFPMRKITINLAPAELPKDGTYLDLPVALSILALNGSLKQAELDNIVFAGELALDGRIRPIKGAINVVETAKQTGFSCVVLPVGNLAQTSMIDGIEIIGAKDLKSLFLHLKGQVLIGNSPVRPLLSRRTKNKKERTKLDNIIGQEQAKRALIIAVAGRHNLILNGPPGAGKTMLAKTALELLPPLSKEESLATTKIHSLAKEIEEEILSDRPFRAPHHTASRTSIIGGGNIPSPGEISLAHLGVLFLDELPEYPRSVIESLRQPMEDKEISISRAKYKLTYPANFMLIATMNPCPCGYYGDDSKDCTCSGAQISKYQQKISGPMLDRIDLSIGVSRVASNSLLKQKSTSNSQHSSALSSIKQALRLQRNRFKTNNKYNSSMSNTEIKALSKLTQDAKKILDLAADKLSLSARSYMKTIKVARTIADLAGSSSATKDHISEALSYRSSDFYL